MNNGADDAVASWALFHKEKNILLSGLVPKEESQTNNTGELMAIKKAIALLVYLNVYEGVIVTDSEYSINSLTKWDIEKPTQKRQPKKNYKLIKDIKEKMKLVRIRFKWVKGHSIDPYNDLVDNEARKLVTKKS